jgi:diadenosine tetraphosphate (Ap4A) HIT family hydrolase
MCVFCDIVRAHRYGTENASAVAFPDAYPLSPGHTLIVPRRHETDYFSLSEEEQTDLWSLIPAVKREIERTHRPSGYNLGTNSGKAAGQTIEHLHLHVIPRYRGDVEDPRGGVRWVDPSPGTILAGG